MEYIYNFFLFRYRRDEYLAFAQARLTFNFCLVTALFSLMYIGIASLIHFHVSIIVMTILAILFTGLAFLIRTTIPLKILSLFYLIFSYFGSVILIYKSGMMYSGILPWLTFIPLSANLLIHRKAAIVWLIICFMTVFFIAYRQETLSNIQVFYDKDYDKFFYAIVYNGLTGIILALSMVFQKAKETVMKTLEEKNNIILLINQELKNKNIEIISQNEELIQQKEEIVAQREFIEIKNRELLLVQDELSDLVNKLTNAQDALARREKENRSILDAIYSTELLVGELNLEGKFLKISPNIATFLGIHELEIVGKTFNEISEKTGISFGGTFNFREMWSKIVGGKNSSHEVHVVINGNEYWLQQNFFPIPGIDGIPIKIMIVGQDISQIKNQQGEIEILNIDLKENIWKIEKQNQLLLTQRKEIETINEELKKSNEEIRTINLSLESRVKERTKYLESQNKQLSEYAYINAHLLRGPLCSILGLVHLLASEKDQDSDQLIFHMKKSSQELRSVVDKISKAIEKGDHFDRNLIYKN